MKEKLPLMATSTKAALKYIRINDCFPKQYDRVFGKCVEAAMEYASFLEDRLPEYIENMIVKLDEPLGISKQDFVVRYASHLYELRIRLPKKLEKLLLDSPSEICEYGESIRGRVPLYLEKELVKDLCYAYFYAKNIARQKFPEKIHNMIIAEAIKNPTTQSEASKYFELCKEFEQVFVARYEDSSPYLTVSEELNKYKKLKFLDELSECDHIVYNILKRLSKKANINEIIKNFEK
jgi:hypothetical protein